jgi:toxin ParE1/3/4
VPRLFYRSAALRDLAGIATYIERESGSREVADTFIEKITDYCEKLATLPGLLGRTRPELRPQYRSITFGSYVIFLRYGDDDAPRSHLYIVNIIHGARDIDAYFASHPEED